MRLADKKDFEQILEYLEKDIGNCVYLYMDIKKYGLEDGHIKVWVNSEEKLTTVVMRYYDSLQIYADKQLGDYEGIRQCVLKEKVKMVSGEKTVIAKLLENDFIRKQYADKEGFVYLFKDYKMLSCEEIEEAKLEDMEEIANLMCMDDNFAKNYKPEILAKQLRERMLTKMGRNYVIRKDNKIIAHIATFAEDMGIAVTSGLIVHPKYRNYPYGTIMESYLVNVLQRENFKVFTFVNERKRIKLLKALGSEECGCYATLKRC